VTGDFLRLSTRVTACRKKIRISDPFRLTGGEYGLEGSRMAAGVLFSGIAVVVMTCRNPGNDTKRYLEAE
jgi:hypothetical protein